MLSLTPILLSEERPPHRLKDILTYEKKHHDIYGTNSDGAHNL